MLADFARNEVPVAALHAIKPEVVNHVQDVFLKKANHAGMCLTREAVELVMHQDCGRKKRKTGAEEGTKESDL